MQQDPTSATSDTYELKIAMLENSKPEEFLKMMKEFKTAVNGIKITSASSKTKYLRTLLSGEALREFYGLEIQVTGTTNSHLTFIKEGLLEYSPPIHALIKQKRGMRRAMRKPQDIPMKKIAARLTKLNN